MHLIIKKNMYIVHTILIVYLYFKDGLGVQREKFLRTLDRVDKNEHDKTGHTLQLAENE